MEQAVTHLSPQQLTKLRKELHTNGAMPIPLTKPLQLEEDDFDLHQVLATLRRRAWLLAGVTGIAAVSITAWNLSRPEVHQGKFRLLVEPVTESKKLTESVTETLGQQAQTQEGLDYDTQIQVLMSEPLLAPTVEKIQAKYPDFSYKELIGNLQIVHPESTKILEFSYQAEDPEQVQFVLTQLSQRYLEYSVDDRKTNVKRAIEFVDEQIKQQQQQVTKIEAALEAFRRQNNLNDPTEQATSLSEQMSRLLDQQRSNQVKLEAARTLYANLQQQVNLSPQQAVAVATLSEAPIYQDLVTQLRKIDSDIATQSSLFTENAPEIQVLQDQRNQLVPLVQAEAQRVLGESGLSAQIDSAQLAFQGKIKQDLIQQYVDTLNQVQTLQAQDQAITQTIGQLNQNIQSMAGVSRQYGEIQRKLQIAATSLDRLLAAREDLQLEAARQESPWEMISQIDTSTIQNTSGLPRKLVLGLIGSVILGAGAALLAEKVDRTVHSVDDLKNSKLPCLGIVPYSNRLQDTVLQLQNVHPEVSDAPKEPVEEPANLAKLSSLINLGKRQKKSQHYYTAPFMEAFYSLEANLRLLDADSPIQSLTITSASPGDGKSTVATHLALAAANMGRRVLLIDTDLRRPQVHKLFGVTNGRGLSNVLSTGADLRQAIQAAPQDKNLYLLPAGTLPPAPGRLLSSKKMRLLMEQLKQRFDLVILDAPPLLGFADAKLSASHTDGILMVVGLGKTDRTILKHVLDDLNTTAQAPVLGFVANGMKQFATSYYNSAYYHNYYKQ